MRRSLVSNDQRILQVKALGASLPQSAFQGVSEARTSCKETFAVRHESKQIPCVSIFSGLSRTRAWRQSHRLFRQHFCIKDLRNQAQKAVHLRSDDTCRTHEDPSRFQTQSRRRDCLPFKSNKT